jgi:hypothetical protein
MRAKRMTDKQIEQIQELSRQRWNRLVEREERDLLKAVVDEATQATKAAAKPDRQR